MCGIVGYIGKRNCADVLIDSLRKLEYRGYDSAGLAVRDGEELAEVRGSSVPIGYPVWNTGLRILDAMMHPVPPGVARTYSSST